jgi:hypothetical protein
MNIVTFAAVRLGSGFGRIDLVWLTWLRTRGSWVQILPGALINQGVRSKDLAPFPLKSAIRGPLRGPQRYALGLASRCIASNGGGDFRRCHRHGARPNGYRFLNEGVVIDDKRSHGGTFGVARKGRVF